MDRRVFALLFVLMILVSYSSTEESTSIISDNLDLLFKGQYPSDQPGGATDGPHPEKGVSHGYVFNHGQWAEDDYGEEPTFPAAGNGGVWSSVEELAQYERALKSFQFLKAETMKDSRTIKNFANWNDISPPFIGWSWFVTQQDSLTLVGHSGSQGGFLSNYVTIPEKKIFFVILCNAPREEYEMQKTTVYVLNILKEYNWLDND